MLATGPDTAHGSAAICPPMRVLPSGELPPTLPEPRVSPAWKFPPLMSVAIDGALMESAAILDYLDDLVGPERALLPARGLPRRQAQQCMALASGAAEKAVLLPAGRLEGRAAAGAGRLGCAL